MLDLSFLMPVFVLFSHLGVELQSEQTEETHVLQPWLKPQSEQWPVLQNIWNDWMHSPRQHAKERDNKTHCHNQTIPGGGVNLPSRSSLHWVFCSWFERLEQNHEAGKASAVLRWADQRNPHGLVFKLGHSSSGSSYLLCHPSLCHTYKHPDLEDESKMCLHQMYLSSLFTPIQTALAFFLPLQLVSATQEQKSI